MFSFPEPGTYLERRTTASFASVPAIFLDRDGVVVEETHYLHSVDEVRFIPDVADAVACANAARLPVVMITNQAGVGRGFYGWDDFRRVQEHIYDHFADHGAHFDLVLACAYHEAGQPPFRIPGHPWRKPNPGMLLTAREILKLDLARSHVIGDTLADLSAGEAAGLTGGTLVSTGHGTREWHEKGQVQFDAWAGGPFQSARSTNAASAIRTQLDQMVRHDLG